MRISTSRRVATKTGRKIFNMSSPGTLLRAKIQFKNATFEEEVMRKPVLRPSFAIQLSALNVNRLVAGIEVDVADSGHVPGDCVCDAHFLEVGWSDQVDVLTWDWPKTHHAQHNEGTHRSAVIVACDTHDGIVELRRDIEVAVLGGQRGPAGVVELIHGQESLLVAHVE